MRLFIWIWGSPEWDAPDARMGCSAQDAWDEIGECWKSVQILKKKLSTARSFCFKGEYVEKVLLFLGSWPDQCTGSYNYQKGREHKSCKMI